MDSSGSSGFKIIPEGNFRQALLLLLFAALMVAIRTLPIYDLIFTNWSFDHGNYVSFSADDSVYHMRLVHNTLYHYPWRVFFDPFTHFPYGNQIHFGPLFTLIIATAALIAGLGHPSAALVNIVGAYTPVVMGALCLIPIYFIARRLSGKTAAIITALILAFLPGEFLQRTALGFTDHHAAEVLFSVITCAFLICALDISRRIAGEFSFNKLALKEQRDFLAHTLFAGVAFGLYILVWPAALMLGAIFLLFLISQLVIHSISNTNAKYLVALTTFFYGMAAVMVLPYSLMNPHLELSYYSLTQPLILAAMSVVFFICYIVYLGCRRHLITRNLYSLMLTLVFASIFFGLYYLVPKFCEILHAGIKMLFEPSPGMRTVSEVQPSILIGNKYTIARLWGTYFWSLPLAVIGLVHLSYRSCKRANPSEVFLLIWSVSIILAAIAQCRFNYYLAINVAILAGCYGFYPLLDLLSSLQPASKMNAVLQKVAVSTVFSVFIFLIVDPTVLIAINRGIPSGIHVTPIQYDAYTWLKNHTPDPQGKVVSSDFDYDAGYYPIPKNPSLPYNYPNSAYGVMAWWEFGHQITYIAKRIPNTNPFQVGITENDGTAGSALFFTTASEIGAFENLNTIGTRYIFVDSKTASNIGGIAVWLDDFRGWMAPIMAKLDIGNKLYDVKLEVDSERFHRSMLSRLYYDDGNGLQHFRLIYESPGGYIVSVKRAIFKDTQPLQVQLDTKVLNFRYFADAIKVVNDINRLLWINRAKNILAYSARRPAKEIKIFEKVIGATIIGGVSSGIADGTKLVLTLRLRTKYDRDFVYEQIAEVIGGRYKFVVPYPTESMVGEDYSYDIEPAGLYKLQLGDRAIEISVPEEKIMQGGVVEVPDF